MRTVVPREPIRREFVRRNDRRLDALEQQQQQCGGSDQLNGSHLCAQHAYGVVCATSLPNRKAT
jgi:hypothetical protein